MRIPLADRLRPELLIAWVTTADLAQRYGCSQRYIQQGLVQLAQTRPIFKTRGKAPRYRIYPQAVNIRRIETRCQL